MAEIRNYVKPRRLYRYRPIEHIQRELEAIEEGYLYCAAYNDMNDPMEGMYAASNRLRNSPVYREFERDILSNKRNLGICSFSEVHSNELMWAHYASRFKGICIEYDLIHLLRRLPNEVDFVRMLYSEEHPNVGLTRTGANDLAKMVLSYKNHRWSYEREWRLFAPQQGKLYYDDQKCVARVYIGAKALGARREIERRLRSLHVKMSVMYLNGYSMIFDPREKYDDEIEGERRKR